jgi:hypothetical protein
MGLLRSLRSSASSAVIKIIAISGKSLHFLNS